MLYSKCRFFHSPRQLPLNLLLSESLQSVQVFSRRAPVPDWNPCRLAISSSVK